ncbi:MAG: penicillin acylase family protein, partial [Phycisphaerales bacterium]
MKTRFFAHPIMHLVMLAGAVVTMSNCVATPPRPSSVTAEGRIKQMRHTWPGLRADATIRYDEHMIPYIEVEDEADAPYAIGLVHAQLRLTQMDMFRRIARGRLAESAGAIARPIDEAIRAFDLTRAVPEMARQLPPDTRAWIERYVEGVNDYRATLRQTPADFRTLGFSLEEPWTVEDVLAFGRLASVDVNWGRWLSTIPLRHEAGYEDFARRLWAFSDDGMPSFGPEVPTDLDVLLQTGRTGSNAFIVGGERSASGSALIGSDPHLGLNQPNIWCVVAYRTPERTVAGLTMPGLPFVLVGRNEHIGWTGTNMQSSSSILYELPDQWEPVHTREESIRTRWWRNSTARIRESEWGPVISDAAILGRLGAGEYALAWRGHLPSDETSAFFRASHATNWEEFRNAFDTFATGGQNMLYGDREGNIGQIMAIEAIPGVALASRLAPVQVDDDRFRIGEGVSSTRLPFAFNPPEGFLASSNNVPTRFTSALVAHGNANDRIVRIQQVLREITSERPATKEDIRALQRDVYSRAAHHAAKAFVDAAVRAGINPQTTPVIRALEEWDGHYTEDSVGAAAYQRVLDLAIDDLYADQYSPTIRRAMRTGSYTNDFIRQDLEADAETGAYDQIIRSLVDRASIDFDPAQAWGDLHRLSIAHPLANIPVIGRRYTFDNIPSAGSTTTVHKSAHAVSRGRHQISFGANARMISNESDRRGAFALELPSADAWNLEPQFESMPDDYKTVELIRTR